MIKQISLCRNCYCMTRTVKGKCGKCKVPDVAIEALKAQQWLDKIKRAMPKERSGACVTYEHNFNCGWNDCREELTDNLKDEGIDLESITKNEND